MNFRPIKHLLFVLSLLFTVSSGLAQPTILGINITGPSPTNDPSLQWNVVFSEPVAGVTQSNFTLNAAGTAGTIGAVAPVAGNQTWTVTVDGVTGTGTLGVDLSNPAGITGGSGALADTAVGDVYQVDNTQPRVVSITRIDATPTSATRVSFAVLFDEPVYNVGTINFAPSGTLSGTPDSVSTADNLTWVVTVSGISGSGTIGLDLTDTSSIIDAAGNPLFSDFIGGEQYDIDQTGPQLVCITRLDANPTSATTVRFLVEFDEPTTGVQISNFTISGAGTTGNISAVDPGLTPETWIVTVDTITGQGTLGVDLTDPTGIVDGFGNTTTSTGASCEFYDVDLVAPEIVAIVAADASPTSSTTVNFFIIYNEPVTNPALSDLTLILNGVTGTISGIVTSGNQTTVTVTGVSGAGSLCLQANAPTTITDLTGNLVSNVPFSGGCYVICNDAPQVIDSFPADGETTVTTADFIGWVQPAANLNYIIYFDGTFQGTTTGTLFPIPGPLSPGQHSYLIDIEGSCTSGTEVFFNVLNAPVLIFPGDGYRACAEPRGFSWEAVDGATTYTVLVDTTIVGTTTGTELLTTQTLGLAPGTHTWTVQAFNDFGSTQTTRNFVILAEDPIDPTVFTTNGTIHSIVTVGSTAYVGGEFSLVWDGANWNARNNIAAFTINGTTATLTGWSPSVNGAVYALEADGARILLGGNFTRINNEPRARIGALDRATTDVLGFAPGANAAVRAIEVVNGNVMFGGDFTRIGSQVFNFADPGIPAIRLATADATSTSTAGIPVGPNPNASVRDILYDGTHVYVAGVFSQIAEQPIRGLAQFDASSTGGLTLRPDFDIDVDLYVYSLLRLGNRLYFGGSFNSVMGAARQNVAAVTVGDSASSVSLTSWNPRTDSAVHSVDATSTDSPVYIGGTFTTVKQLRNAYLAGVDPVFGFPLTCGFNSDRVIYSIQAGPEGVVNAEQILAGGQSTQTGTMPPVP